MDPRANEGQHVARRESADVTYDLASEVQGECRAGPTARHPDQT